ncbi:hypothetical protein PE067_14780 [Paracoccus sp. DMF-8]|uniref:hypothetical protein n=1 Tax=Paracoccus sp. DMF-8 TaxID=3019445 RepID=UPI0023E3FA65|nr:hypothetical protein [Paracoccus sp. DMF-8]MDF3607282.1 hypothetical protein [Paracoccus sp. DMF-8]
MTQLNLGIAAVLAFAGMSVAAQADPLSAGQRMAERFLHGDVEAIWSASTPEMQQAFGSAGNLAALHDDLLADFGTEDTILSERMDAQAGHDVTLAEIDRFGGKKDAETAGGGDHCEALTARSTSTK